MNVPVLTIFFLWLLATAFWWAFAFLQLPGPAPEWLVAAREVCFGQTPTGLPDGEGWRLLFIPPLFMFLGMVFVYWSDLKNSFAVFLRRPLGLTITVFVAVGLLTEMALITKLVIERWPKGDELTSAAALPVSLPSGYPQTTKNVPQFILTSQDKQKFSDRDFIGKKTILTFAFANCHTVCPMLIKNSVNAIKPLEPKDHQLVIITLDPWRDSPTQLKMAAQKWEVPPNTSFLGGEVDKIKKVLTEFNVPFERNKKNGFITHPALVYVLNRNGKIAYSFNNPSVKWLNDALERL